MQFECQGEDAAQDELAAHLLEVDGHELRPVLSDVLDERLPPGGQQLVAVLEDGAHVGGHQQGAYRGTADESAADLVVGVS